MINETHQTSLFDRSPTNGKAATSAPDEERPGYQFVKRVGWIPDDWSAEPIDNLTERIQSGVSVNGSDTPAGDEQIGVLKVSSVTYGDFRPHENKAVLEEEQSRVKCSVRRETILVSRANTLSLVGASAYVECDWPNLYLPDKLWEVRGCEAGAVSTRWLGYALASPRVRWLISAAATGSSASMKNVSQADFLNIRIPTPPAAEQRKIARILGAWDRALADLDALIEAKRRQKKGLAQRLLTGRVRLPGFGGAEMVETKIGAVPSDWREVRFGKVFKRQSEKNEGSAIDHVITVGKYAIRPQSEHFDKSVASADLSAYNVIRPGDFVYDPMSAYYGAIGRYDYDEPGIVSPVYRVLTLRRRFDSGFVRHLLGAHYVRHRIASYSTQGNKEGKRRGLQHDAFEAIPVFVPPEEEQRRIAAVLDAADAEIATLEAQRDALARQKRGLMQRLLTGEVRVTPDPEDHRPKEPGA